MKRQPILALLGNYLSNYAQEADTVTRFRNFVINHPDCFERSLSVGHVTGSAWVVNQAGTHVLLTHHKKLNQWFQLGGHADGESDILKAALTEVAEESGLAAFEPVSAEIFDIDIHAIPARGDEPEHCHYDVRFAVRAVSSDEYIVGEESHDLSWVEIVNLADFTREESMLRMAGKWQEFYK